jgi:hypothetical protein
VSYAAVLPGPASTVARSADPLLLRGLLLGLCECFFRPVFSLSRHRSVLTENTRRCVFPFNGCVLLLCCVLALLFCFCVKIES